MRTFMEWFNRQSLAIHGPARLQMRRAYNAGLEAAARVAEREGRGNYFDKIPDKGQWIADRIRAFKDLGATEL